MFLRGTVRTPSSFTGDVVLPNKTTSAELLFRGGSARKLLELGVLDGVTLAGAGRGQQHRVGMESCAGAGSVHLWMRGQKPRTGRVPPLRQCA